MATEFKSDTASSRRSQLVGRLLGPAILIIMLFTESLQSAMDPTAWRVAAVGLWMAIWWATEAIPVPATALLPVAVFEPLGISTIRDTAAPYASPIIFLFLGGFVLALAIERWNLHRRISLAILERTGTGGKRLIGGFMFVCMLLSMWMTNTSTTMMLLPIALSVILVINENSPELSATQRSNFQTAMLLGLAYSASIGGLATLIGTPPNAFLAGYLSDTYGLDVGFARWMMVGLPISMLLLPAAWLLLTKFIYPVSVPASSKVEAHLDELHEKMGPITAPERRVAFVFVLVVTSWILRRPLSEWAGLQGVSDAGIVITAAILLFVLPSGKREQPTLMKWENLKLLPWGVLVLFGGGLTLASAVSDSGLALWLGGVLAPLNELGAIVLVVAAVTLVIFLTELTSNLATTATLLPVMGALAATAGLPPILLMTPVAMAASCAFMLPVATPPNAIVFATGQVSIPQMIRAGMWLNLLSIVLVAALASVLARSVFGN